MQIYKNYTCNHLLSVKNLLHLSNNLINRIMAKYNFTVSGGLLSVTLDEEAGRFSPETLSYLQASTELSNNRITLYNFGCFEKDFEFNNIGLVNGVTPSTIANANTLILGLISTASATISGGSVTQYNTPTNYDTVANLPISFPTNTIHEISVLSKVGNTQITVRGEISTLSVGQSTTISADGLINGVISIDSCTGEFLATTIS